MPLTFVQIRRTNFKRGVRFSVLDPKRDLVLRTFRTEAEAEAYVDDRSSELTCRVVPRLVAELT